MSDCSNWRGETQSCHPVARGTPPGTPSSAAGHEGGPGKTFLCPRPEPAGGPRAVPELDGPGGSGRGDSNGSGPTHPHAGTEDGAAGRPGGVPRLVREDRRGMWVAPLLTGEAQLAAQQLPVQNLLVYDDLKRAILQRVGQSPEQHRQRFRSLELGENGRPFTMAHQLRDACHRWLMAGDSDVEQIIDRVVLEQFIARLPQKTAQWVQCHRPASLDLAIQLAEDQMVVCPGVGETLPSVSLSLPSSSSFSPPTFLPRSHAGVLPRAQPRWRGGRQELAAVRAHAREAGSARPSSASIPVPPGSPSQFLFPLPATAWAGLLALRGPGPLYRSMSSDGGGDTGPGSGRPTGCPRSGWRVPNTCEY